MLETRSPCALINRGVTSHALADRADEHDVRKEVPMLPKLEEVPVRKLADRGSIQIQTADGVDVPQLPW